MTFMAKVKGNMARSFYEFWYLLNFSTALCFCISREGIGSLPFHDSYVGQPRNQESVPSIFTATSRPSEICPLRVFSAQESPDVVLNGDVLGKIFIVCRDNIEGNIGFLWAIILKALDVSGAWVLENPKPPTPAFARWLCPLLISAAAMRRIKWKNKYLCNG